MSVIQVVGPYLNDNEQVVQTDSSYTIDKSHQVVIVTRVGLQLTMPPNPDPGETHQIIAAGGGVALLGGGHSITVSFLPLNRIALITFSGTIWLVGEVGAPVPDDDAVIFDGGGARQNIRSARTSDQSPVAFAKEGIVNLSSKTAGLSTGATGNFSTIGGGDQNSASGDYSTVPGGIENKAIGFASHAEGRLTQALGSVSHAEGFQTSAGTDPTIGFGGAHAEGVNTTATAGASHAEGMDTAAVGLASRASGLQSQAERTSQDAFASGVSDFPGCQTSQLVLRGTVPGVLPGESVALGYGRSFPIIPSEKLFLNINRSYAIDVQCAATRESPGDGVAFFQKFLAEVDGVGTITLTSGPQERLTAGIAGTLVVAPGVAPGELEFLFTNAGRVFRVNVVCRIRFTEIGITP